ncbi:MAG: acyl-CoA/acyl-ACP dehydrogenase [Hellea sp.]|nr:acyl-CoA/acyl-ACP dehydrogenase [Hellea sp.]
MAYPFTEDHDMIREAVRGWAQAWYDGGKGPERVYQSGTGFDLEAWQALSGELGMAGVAIKEEYGGAGLGDLGRVVVMEELGASLCSVPFQMAGGICTDILQKLGTASGKSMYLPRIASGQICPTYVEGLDAFSIKESSLSGVVSMNAYGNAASHFLISFQRDKKVSLGVVMAANPNIEVEQQKTLDPTRSLAKITFNNLSLDDVKVIGTTDRGRLQDIVDQSFIALAAECVGGAQKCLDITLEYAGQREQFDRPIASFQAYKHRCADMFIALEEARSATYAAAIARPDDKTEAALIAKVVAADAYFKIAGDAIQLHGGIGFTWEYPLHFFFKRARANRSIFGSTSRGYNKIADRIFGNAA